MNPITQADSRRIAVRQATVRVPQHVVFRQFAAETVVLSLETGMYHGLNPVGGRMLQVLGEAGRVDAAAITLAKEYGQPLSDIERDLCNFCLDLAERGLIELD